MAIISPIHLENTGDGRDQTYTGQGSLSIPLAKKFWTAKLTESFTYAKYQSEKTALSTLTGTKDVAKSHEYNICNLNNQTELILEYSNYTKKVGIAQAMVKVGWNYQNQEREEYFPTFYRFPRTFRTMNGVAQLNYNFSSFEKMSIQYSRYMEPDLDIEKLRGVMNDTDPLCLTIGNPDLDIPIVNEFKFSLNLNSKDFSRTCMLSLNLNISSDRVVENTRYFEQSTILEEYDNYIIPVGATLTTWENCSGYWNLSATLNYNFRSQPLKSTFRFMLMGIKEETPIFIQGKPTKMKNMNFSITPEMNTAFSTRFQASLLADTRLHYNDNGEHVNCSFTENLSMNLTGIIAKDYTLSCSPSWKYQYDREIPAGNFNDVILNFSLNKKWGKKKHFSTKIEGYDLLNQTNGIRSSLKEDYYQITREATLGRYILLRCEYKF